MLPLWLFEGPPWRNVFSAEPLRVESAKPCERLGELAQLYSNTLEEADWSVEEREEREIAAGEVSINLRLEAT